MIAPATEEHSSSRGEKAASDKDETVMMMTLYVCESEKAGDINQPSNIGNAATRLKLGSGEEVGKPGHLLSP